MVKFNIPGTEGRRMMLSDLRTGYAGWISRAALSLVSAAAILSAAMLWMGLLEASTGRLRDEHIALTMGVAGAIWCGVLALLWWTYRRFQVTLKAAFAVIATWAIVLPGTLLIDSMMQQGEEYLIAAAVLLGIAISFASIIQICYLRVRKGTVTRAIVRVRVACPNCGSSFVGLRVCRCPECGSEYTIETLVDALGRGDLVAEGAIEASEPEPIVEAPSAQRALPEPGSHELECPSAV